MISDCKAENDRFFRDFPYFAIFMDKWATGGQYLIVAETDKIKTFDLYRNPLLKEETGLSEISRLSVSYITQLHRELNIRENTRIEIKFYIGSASPRLFERYRGWLAGKNLRPRYQYITNTKYCFSTTDDKIEAMLKK